MSASLVLIVLTAYFSLLILISLITSHNANTQDFFVANKQSPWFLVAFGMIGASLSGVTFISVPGAVLSTQFSYFQMVLGYLLGYWVIGGVLLPLYYRLNLISIYSYLDERFGFWSYKTGSFFFLLSRTIGASFRLFLAAMVLQLGLFDHWGMPFWATTVICIGLIWVYTYRGGIKTIVWTDTLQTTFLLVAVVMSVILIKDDLNLSFQAMIHQIFTGNYAKIWYWDDPLGSLFFPKQFISGAFIAIVMTGLDQDLMQKNLTCRNIGEAQKNMFWFSIVLVIVNLIFLCLGALLYMYTFEKGIDVSSISTNGQIRTDKIYPFLALNHFGLVAGIFFLLGITAATYASADSALTSLTTSFCVDFLHIMSKDEAQKKVIVRRVHLFFSLLLVLMILLFKEITDAYPKSNVIGNIFAAASYTYGPLLGLYAFGLLSRLKVRDSLVPWVCVVAPILTYLINTYSETLFFGYIFAYEHLILNGLLTFIGLWFISLPYED
ncbi:MAG: sodium:solute symporter [Microscillaceae bacterium]|nr:sodium:solute symporter [Microscillaceae bacterium]